ncbi:MAG: hypothetical protein IKU95_05630, partial [Clostridia bacterium]|nr:hypothetical protein [Clostridia bacterium]
KIALKAFDKEEMVEILQNEERRKEGGATVVCNGDNCTMVPAEQIVCNGDTCTMPGQKAEEEEIEEIPAIPEF